MNFRDVLLRKFRKSKTKNNTIITSGRETKFKNMTKQYKQYHNKNILEENAKNTETFWKSLKKIFSVKPKGNQSNATFSVDGSAVSDVGIVSKVYFTPSPRLCLEITSKNSNSYNSKVFIQISVIKRN